MIGYCSFCWRLTGRGGVKTTSERGCDCGCHLEKLVNPQFNKRRGGKP